METCSRKGSGLALFVAVLTLSVVPGGAAHADCGRPANAIEAENCLPGQPASPWDASGAGDANLPGVATDVSVNRGETISFKTSTPRPASTSTASATTGATARGS